MNSLKNIKRLSLLSLIIFLIVIFYVLFNFQPWQHSYDGDGNFSDKGATVSSYRYVLTLDKFDLTNAGNNKHIYNIGKLPRIDMRLALRFVLKKEESRGSIDNLHIRLSISEMNEEAPYYEYDGKLYTPDSGFIPTEYTNSHGDRIIVMYSREPFYQQMMLFGQPAGFYKQGRRRLGFEIVDALEKPISNNYAELIIFGGGWK